MNSRKNVELRGIPSVNVRSIRSQVLRPDLSWEQLNYQGDEEPGALHVGAYLEDRQLGVASVYRMSPAEARECVKYVPAITGISYQEEKKGGQTLWRLRGMATLPDVRGQGFGARLLLACVGHAARSGGQRIWCTARTGVAGFYTRQGFTIDSLQFEIPNVGPHYFMSRMLFEKDKLLERDVFPSELNQDSNK